MKIVLLFMIACVSIVSLPGCQAACSTVSSAPVPMPEVPGTGSATAPSGPQVFVETTWPVILSSNAGWRPAEFMDGRAPSILATARGPAAVGVRSREGDVLLGLDIAGSSVDATAELEVKVFAVSALDRELISDVTDSARVAEFRTIDLPLKAPRAIAAGEGVILLLLQSGPNYEVSTIRARWSRP